MKPVMNSMEIAMAFDTRNAGPAFVITMNGITTGKVERKTSSRTATAPCQSSLLSPARSARSGSCRSLWFTDSNSSGRRMDAITGGSASVFALPENLF